MQIGGGALAILALMNDPGVNMKDISSLLEANQKCMIRKLTEGYGDGGYFKEGDGTGSMGHIAFMPALQAWRVAGGLDFITPRPNAQWTSLRWLLGTVVKKDGTKLFHKRDGYPHNAWGGGISGGNYFGIGFGLASPRQQAGWLWFYNHNFLDRDMKAGAPYDTGTEFPHHSILSFVNWPWGMKERNPAECIPRASVDHTFSYCMFRNRWQDENDIVITFLGQRPRSHTSPSEIGPIWITAFGQELRWKSITGGIKHFAVAKDGSAIVAAGGQCLAVDFSGASGAEAMLVLTGGADAAPPAKSGKKGGKPASGGEQLETETVRGEGAVFQIAFLTQGAKPALKEAGGKITAGEQSISFRDGLILLGKWAGQ